MSDAEFRKWMRENYGLIVSTARLAGDSIPGYALEDIIQELTITCWEVRETYDPANPSGAACNTFLRTVMERRVWELARGSRCKKRQGAAPPVSLEALDGDGDSLLGSLPSPENVEEKVYWIMELDAVWTQIRTLPPKHQEWVRMYVYGYSEREIARQWGVGRSYVSRVLRRFRETLRAKGIGM